MRSNMRVIILVPGLPVNLEKIRGGVHSAVANLLRGFTALPEVQIRAIAFSREVEEEKTVKFAPNIEICYVPEGNFPYHSINYLLHGPRILKKHIKQFRPDIIHYEEGNTFMFTKLFGLKNTKYLLTIHGMSFDEAKRKKKIKDKITWYFNGLVAVYMAPGNIIHLSNFSKNKHANRKIVKQSIIPNAIVPAYFQVAQKGSTDNIWLYIGIIDNNKNLIFQLEALKELVSRGKFYKLEVLGDFSNDAYKDLILSYVKDNKLEDYVHFNGWVSQPEVLSHIAKADILVVSSKHESLPMVIAESMAAGKVVVASTVGGIPEMVQDQVNGFLYDLSEPEKLVNILSDLYNNNEKIKSISAKAKETAIERYQCENVARKTLAFYKQCLV